MKNYYIKNFSSQNIASSFVQTISKVSHKNCLPALNPIICPTNEVHIVRPPQAAQVKRGRFNHLQPILPIKISEPHNISNEATVSKITVSPPKEIPNQNKSNPRFRRQNDKGFIIGYRGEAYVYEMLQKEEKFKDVVWNALSNDSSNPCVTTVDGKTYFIKEDGLPYDLFAKDENDEEYYFEVKSTASKMKEVTISRCQAKLARKLSNLNEHHVVAVVFNVNENPSAIYYKKLNDLIS